MKRMGWEKGIMVLIGVLVIFAWAYPAAAKEKILIKIGNHRWVGSDGHIRVCYNERRGIATLFLPINITISPR